MLEKLLIAWHFARTRWLPASSLRSRDKRYQRFLERIPHDYPFYRDKTPAPILTKQLYLENFGELNRHGINREEATEAALRAERERNFRPELREGITVGLSSGTSGSRHVFLVGRSERCRWAGQIMAYLLDSPSVSQIVNPFAPPLRLAFFLRANSNLYTTLSSSRLHFDYYDLIQPFHQLLESLAASPPDILVAPATVLAELARARPAIRPRQVISVAEVLDSRDRQLVEDTFSTQVREIYQAAEGFLGCSCQEGRIHLNEESLHIEPIWTDESHSRFFPVLTDFSRTTQCFVRYRLEDILVPDPTPCPCGRKTTSLLRIEGRAEEVLWLKGENGKLAPVFPETIRQAIYSLEEPPARYRIHQQGTRWEVQASGGNDVALVESLRKMIRRLGLEIPSLSILPWTEQPLSEKEKRIRCLSRPE